MFQAARPGHTIWMHVQCVLFKRCLMLRQRCVFAYSNSQSSLKPTRSQPFFRPRPLELDAKSLYHNIEFLNNRVPWSVHAYLAPLALSRFVVR